MRDYVLLTDSCCDLSAEMAAELGVEILPLSLEMGGKSYRNYPDGRDIGFQEFYTRLRAGELATTSAVNVGEFEDKMRALLQTGRDILCLSFSSALSTTYQSSVIAAEELRSEFPDARIETVDTLCASLGQGLLVYLCAMEKQKGRSLDEVKTFAEQTRLHVCHWFTVDDLNHLKRGGRISAATALFGTMLSIKPVMHVDDEGRLIPVSKARGRRASLLALVDRMAQTAIDPANQTVFISHGDCLEDAEFVASELRRRLNVQTIHINYVGPVIGNHSGPGTMALFFLAGVLLGQVLSGRVPDTTGDELRRYLEDYVRLGGEGAPTVQTALSALVIYFRYPLFAFLLGFASIGVVLLPCVTAAYGFFLSFSVCCFTAAFGVDGVLLALAVFGLRCMVTLPCYFLLAAASWGTSAGLAAVSFGRGRRTAPVVYGRACWVRFGACCLALLAGVCAELFLSPVLLRLMLERILG